MKNIKFNTIYAITRKDLKNITFFTFFKSVICNINMFLLGIMIPKFEFDFQDLKISDNLLKKSYNLVLL